MTLIRNDDFGPQGLGELSLDNRPAGGELRELETYTCTHCSAVVILNPERRRERYKCRGCNHHICDNCAAARAAGALCRTMSQQFDEYLTAVHRQAAEGIILLP